MSKRDSDSGPSHSNKKRRDEPVDRDADVPESERWGKSAEDKPEIVKDEANFGLSGALSKDLATGNAVNGVVKKYNAPVNEILPNTKWRLYVFKPNPKSPKDAELIDTMHIHRAPHYLLGSDEDMADVCLAHDSISGEHAVLQYRQVPYTGKKAGMEGALVCKLYVIDLESRNGTFLNQVKLESKRYYEMRKGDVLTLGGSTREYVLMKE